MTTTTSINLSSVASLVLTRLLIVGEKGEISSKIKKDLEPLLAHRWEGAALTERIDQGLAELEGHVLVVRLPGKTKKAAPKFVPTVDGRLQCLEFLGIAQLKPKTTWATLRKTYLPGRALGMPASTDALFKALSSEPSFQAVLLKREYGLATAEVPKPDEATDALAWQLIGFDGDTRKFTVNNIKTALLNRAAGDGRAADVKKAATRLLAQRLGARRDDPKELRDAVIRGFIDQHETAPAPARLTETLIEPLPTAPAPFDLPAFAEHVKSAARSCPTGRFGDNKVFISHVWLAVKADPEFESMELATFKSRLTEANNARLLDLSRADLVQAMDPADVRESEVHYLNATFHFVRT